MKTPKQRLVSIVEEDTEQALHSISKMLYLTEDQLKEIIKLSKEQGLAAEVVTNSFVVMMTDEELEEYVTAVELVRSKSSTLQDSVSKVMQLFSENNMEVFEKFQKENTTEQ